MKLVIRGFAKTEKVFEYKHDIPEEQLAMLMPRLAMEHAREFTLHEIDMIEIEFEGEPNYRLAYLRVGTSGMELIDIPKGEFHIN
jgi:hypothetical protein